MCLVSQSVLEKVFNTSSCDEMLNYKNNLIIPMFILNYRLQHEQLHAKHKGHEAMHLEMILILFATLAVTQLVLFKWKQYHSRSYQVKFLKMYK